MSRDKPRKVERNHCYLTRRLSPKSLKDRRS